MWENHHGRDVPKFYQRSIDRMASAYEAMSDNCKSYLTMARFAAHDPGMMTKEQLAQLEEHKKALADPARFPDLLAAKKEASDIAGKMLTEWFKVQAGTGDYVYDDTYRDFPDKNRNVMYRMAELVAFQGGQDRLSMDPERLADVADDYCEPGQERLMGKLSAQAMKNAKAYQALMDAEKSALENPDRTRPDILIRRGDGAENHKFASHDMAVAYLQSRVAAHADLIAVGRQLPKTESQHEACGAYPGHEQFGISALGYDGIRASVLFDGMGTYSGVQAASVFDQQSVLAKYRDAEHEMYCDIISKDVIPGGSFHVERHLPLESQKAYLIRCDAAEQYRPAIDFEADAKGTPMDNLVRHATEWTVGTGDSYQASSPMGLAVSGSPRTFGVCPAQDMQDVAQFKDNLIARQAQAEALMLDLSAFNALHGRDDWHTMRPSDDAVLAAGWLSPGTQAHCTGEWRFTPSGSDIFMTRSALGDNMTRRAGMVLFNIDFDKYERMILDPSALEHMDAAGFRESPLSMSRDTMTKSIGHGDGNLANRIQNFAMDTEALLAREQEALTGPGAGPVSKAVLKSPSGVKISESEIATPEFMNRFVAEATCRDYWFGRFREAAGFPAMPERPTLVVSGPAADMTQIKCIVDASRRQGPGSERVSAFDADKVLSVAMEAAADLKQSEAAKQRASARKGLDGKAAEIESRFEDAPQAGLGE